MEEKIMVNLVQRADYVRKNSYAPYSKFPVGCAILLEDGQIIEGVNIENASYPVGICAERSAMAQIITKGLGHMIKAVAVVTDASPPGSPCGMCRQFLNEFIAKDTPLILANPKGEKIVVTMDELLPRAFDKSALL